MNFGNVCHLRGRGDENAVTNPTVLVEVLRRSTEQYDRGDKFDHYKRIASLRHYVLVSHRAHEVEVWTRDLGGDWQSVIARPGEQARLGAIGAVLDVSALYDAVTEPQA